MTRSRLPRRSRIQDTDRMPLPLDTRGAHRNILPLHVQGVIKKTFPLMLKGELKGVQNRQLPSPLFRENIRNCVTRQSFHEDIA